ncbi:helix-turn-helix transcriptional regulator [Raoultella sp. WB_B2P2-3]|uniref:ArsR/SmtB family transcription factor n=1 Tax=Raoultella TaxID=160674 RepID=UPI000BA49007|nr:MULTISPECIES: helix-turn-helix transcriptional regulator [Enterobacteriaceae]MVT01339.1 helix-turn-helix domain-containing protein [Raoultella sp. 10-1]PAC13890.1 transcriptional regulator [Enterobacter sp. 10-1]
MSEIKLNEVLKALSNPVRKEILQWLKEPKKHFHQPDADADEVGVCVSIIQEKVGLSQSTVSLYLAALQRAQLVTSRRIGPWTYYKRDNEKIAEFFQLLKKEI